MEYASEYTLCLSSSSFLFNSFSSILGLSRSSMRFFTAGSITGYPRIEYLIPSYPKPFVIKLSSFSCLPFLSVFAGSGDVGSVLSRLLCFGNIPPYAWSRLIPKEYAGVPLKKKGVLSSSCWLVFGGCLVGSVRTGAFFSFVDLDKPPPVKS